MSSLADCLPNQSCEMSPGIADTALTVTGSKKTLNRKRRFKTQSWAIRTTASVNKETVNAADYNGEEGDAGLRRRGHSMNSKHH